MTTLENRPNTALLVVDVQNGVVEGAHERGPVVANVGSLVERARREQVPVVWVQHSDEDLSRGSEEWRIVPELHPDEAEPLIEKHYGDSFEDTDLEQVLSGLGVGRLVVVGAQTDACIRATLHGAFTGDTTRPWSATRTRPRICPATERHHPRRSSPTRTSTGSTSQRPGARRAPSRPRTSTSPARPDASRGASATAVRVPGCSRRHGLFARRRHAWPLRGAIAPIARSAREFSRNRNPPLQWWDVIGDNDIVVITRVRSFRESGFRAVGTQGLQRQEATR